MLIIKIINQVISRFYHDTLPFRMICWCRDLVSRWFHVPPHCHSSFSLLLSNSKHHHDHHHCTTGNSYSCFICRSTINMAGEGAQSRGFQRSPDNLHPTARPVNHQPSNPLLQVADQWSSLPSSRYPKVENLYLVVDFHKIVVLQQVVLIVE